MSSLQTYLTFSYDVIQRQTYVLPLFIITVRTRYAEETVLIDEPEMKMHEHSDYIGKESEKKEPN